MGQRQQSKAILVSMTTYPSVSLAAALAVALTAGALGKNTSVAVYGGGGVGLPVDHNSHDADTGAPGG